MFENINNDFNYGSIDEVMGVPDPDGVDQLVEAILKRIYGELQTYIYANSPMVGFVINKPIVENTFMLSGDLNICPWLDENTEVVYRYDLKSQTFHKGAVFQPILGKSDVYANIDGLRRIRFAKIILDFSFGQDAIQDRREMRRRYNEMKVLLRHELEHAYGELMKMDQIPETDDESNVGYKEIPQSVFMSGYKKITSKLYSKSYATDEEKNLITAMYLINYLEMNANVAGFYQRLINDYDMAGYIGDIDIYPEFRNYKRSLDFIMNFSNKELFDQYIDEIHNMYGSGVTGINKLRNAMKSKCDKFFWKLEKLYGNLKSDISHNSENIDIRLHEAKDFYLKEFHRQRGIDFDNMDEDEKAIMEAVSLHYMRTEADDYLSFLFESFCVYEKKI